MQTQIVHVLSPNGLHLRAAARIVQECQRFQSRVVLCKGCKYANGCSMLQLLGLEATEGAEVRVVIIGEDEHRAIRALAVAFSDGAGI